jgi:hypothetical protein
VIADASCDRKKKTPLRRRYANTLVRNDLSRFIEPPVPPKEQKNSEEKKH